MTDYLYARPSFLAGVASLLDIFGVFTSYNISPSPDVADSRAIYSDWKVIGSDIKQAVFEVEQADSN